MNVAVYCSDHGYGHITRQLSWIEKTQFDKDNLVYFVCKKASELIEKKHNIVPVSRQTDFGLATDDASFSIDVFETKNLLDRFYQKIPSMVQIEREFIKKKKIDLVISDISPIPLEAASSSSAYSIAISSFDWVWIYDNIFSNHPISSFFKEMYEKTDLALVLPLGGGMRVFPNSKDISLVSRTSNKKFSILKSDKPIVFFSMGKSICPNLKNCVDFSKIQAILPDHLVNDNDVFFKIPRNEKNLCQYLKASDFAIVKTGYSSVAECITHKIPLIGVKRKGIIEDTAIGHHIKELGVGESIFYGDLCEYDIESFNFHSFKNSYKDIPKRFENVGHIEILENISNFL